MKTLSYQQTVNNLCYLYQYETIDTLPIQNFFNSELEYEIYDFKEIDNHLGYIVEREQLELLSIMLDTHHSIMNNHTELKFYINVNANL